MFSIQFLNSHQTFCFVFSSYSWKLTQFLLLQRFLLGNKRLFTSRFLSNSSHSVKFFSIKISKVVKVEDSFDKNFIHPTEWLEVRERNETFSENFSNFVWWLKAEWILENDLFVVVESLLIIYFSDEAFVCNTITGFCLSPSHQMKRLAHFLHCWVSLHEMCETFSRRQSCHKHREKNH